MNQVVMVGKLNQLPSGKDELVITIEVENQLKNAPDYFNVILWKSVADEFVGACSIGCVVGIKGRLKCVNSQIEVVAEKVSILEPTK